MSTEEETMKFISTQIEKVSKVLDAVVTSDRKQKIIDMLEDEHFGQLYFTAPASSRTQYHYAFTGGLVSHSFNVYKNLRLLNKTFDLGFSEESMCIVALFHDIGKASCTNLQSPHYVPTEENWKVEKGWLYEYGQDGVYMPTHVRSMFILQKFGIQLTAEEYTAIYLNDGHYLDENKPYRLKECPLALYTHIADRIALEQEKIQ